MLYNLSSKLGDMIMGVAVNLDNDLVSIARSYSGAESRSVPKQIEHWAKIGRIAEENPELNYGAVKEILLGLEDMRLGNVREYNSDEL
jgi:hypothetical protein